MRLSGKRASALSVQLPKILILLAIGTFFSGCTVTQEKIEPGVLPAQESIDSGAPHTPKKAVSVAPHSLGGGDWEAPRVAGTDIPDLSGIWQAISSAHWDIERHLARPALQLRDGPVVPVPHQRILALGAIGAVPAGMGIIEGGGKIPYTDEALKVRDENRADYLNRDPAIKCYLPGVPRSTYMPFPFEIVQGHNSMFIVYEFANADRILYFEDPGPAPVDSWMGQSYAQWDGDTLVVEVTGQMADTWFDRAGNHHSAGMRVVERWTPTGPNHMQYEATIYDEETFTEPWKISLPLYRRMESDARIMDFKCVEFVEELMYGKWRRNPLPRGWEE